MHPISFLPHFFAILGNTSTTNKRKSAPTPKTHSSPPPSPPSPPKYREKQGPSRIRNIIKVFAVSVGCFFFLCCCLLSYIFGITFFGASGCAVNGLGGEKVLEYVALTFPFQPIASEPLFNYKLGCSVFDLRGYHSTSSKKTSSVCWASLLAYLGILFCGIDGAYIRIAGNTSKPQMCLFLWKCLRFLSFP